MAALLEVANVDVFYGGVQALHSVSISVGDREIVAVLGRNGAGKTTTLRTISGLTRPARGTVHFAGKRIDRVHASAVVGLGIAHVPEGRGIFASLTVAENLRIGHHARKDARRLQDDYERVFQYFPLLKARSTQLGGDLSGGEQQMLAIARAMMLNPKLLMVDELSLGLAPIVVKSLYHVLERLVTDGISILLVEQNVRGALAIANRAYVLDTGSVVLADSAANLRDTDLVRKAYLTV